MVSLGVGMGTVHTMMSNGVAHHCHVHNVPTVIGIVSGRKTTFYGEVTVDQLKEFVASLLPRDVILKV